MNELTGRSAVVTGGSSGIGRTIAVRLARAGMAVVVGDVNLLAENEQRFTALGIREQRCDVRVEEDVRRLIEAAVAAAPLGAVVHSAGVGLVKQIPDVSEEEWDACLDVNLKGAFFVAKHAIGPLRSAGGGSIITISSNAGLLPRAHDPVYSISKAALVALTESLALCHAADRIRVNTICPGPVSDTGMMNADLAAAADRDALRRELIGASPLASAHGRMITPDEVAAAVLYLVGDAAAMVTGTAIRIDGGKSLGVPPR